MSTTLPGSVAGCGGNPASSGSKTKRRVRISTSGSSPSLGAGELRDGAVRFANRVPMIHRTGQIGVRERNAAMRSVAQHVARGRPAVRPKEETRLRIHVGMTPAVENDAGDIAPRIEAAGGKHVAELGAKGALVARERCAQELRATAAALLADRHTGLREQNLDRQHRRRIRRHYGTETADGCLLARSEEHTSELQSHSFISYAV